METETGWAGDEERRRAEEADVDEEETSEGAGECEHADADAVSDVRAREAVADEVVKLVVPSLVRFLQKWREGGRSECCFLFFFCGCGL